MNKQRVFPLTFILVMSLWLSLPTANAASSAVQGQAATAEATSARLVHQLIVKFKSTAATEARSSSAVSTQMSTLSAIAGVDLTYFRAMSGDAHVLRLPEQVTEAEAQAIAARLLADADRLGIDYVEPDYVRQLAVTPSDAFYGDQWNLQAPSSGAYGINVPEAWENTTGSSEVVVAVIDTGLRTDHADLTGRSVTGYDFIADVQEANDGDGRDSDASDPGDWITVAEARNGYFRGCPVSSSSWHGTHVAGIIGATGNNGVGIAGVNWQARILPVRVLGKCGGVVSDIVDAMRWAAGLSVSGVPANSTPARIINLSLSGSGSCSSTEQSAVNEVVNQGVMVVVAAGNSNQSASNSAPANCNNVVAVAATNRAGNKASYSNYGAQVALSAPGGEESNSGSVAILSTVDTGSQSPQGSGYAAYAGTSMAAPQVAGVASLLWSLSPALSTAQVVSILRSTATQFPSGSTCTTTRCGAGIVNAAAAVTAVLSSAAATATPTPTATPLTSPDATATPLSLPVATPDATATPTPDLSTTQPERLYLPLIHNSP